MSTASLRRNLPAVGTARQEVRKLLPSTYLPSELSSPRGSSARRRNALSPAEWRACKQLSKCLQRLRKHRQAERALSRKTVLPIRFAIQLVHSQRRLIFYRELTLFTIFLVGLIVLLLLHSPEIHECWETSEVLKEVLDLEQAGLDANSDFNEVKSVEDMWAWLRDDYADALYGLHEHVGDPGDLQLRMLRNRPVHRHASLPGHFNFDTSDYPAGWANGTAAEDSARWAACEATDPETGWPVWAGASPCFKHHANTFSFLRNSWQKPLGYADYGVSGYLKKLPTNNRTLFDHIVDELQTADFVDGNTVAIAFTVNILNRRSNLLTTVRVMFEYSMTGNVMNSVLISSVKARMYHMDNPRDWSYVILDLLVYSMIFYYTVKMLKDWMRVGRSWVTDFFNVCELLISASTITFLVMYIRFLLVHRRGMAEDTWRTEDITSVPVTYHSLMTTMAWTVLLCVFKMFKYLKLDSAMMVIFDVMSKASGDLASFLLIFVLLLVSFAIVGHFAFGPMMGAFHSPMESISTCMRFMVGDVEYEELRRANPVLAPLFFLTYAVAGVLVLINVFIGARATAAAAPRGSATAAARTVQPRALSRAARAHCARSDTERVLHRGEGRREEAAGRRLRPASQLLLAAQGLGRARRRAGHATLVGGGRLDLVSCCRSRDVQAARERCAGADRAAAARHRLLLRRDRPGPRRDLPERHRLEAVQLVGAHDRDGGAETRALARRHVLSQGGGPAAAAGCARARHTTRRGARHSRSHIRASRAVPREPPSHARAPSRAAARARPPGARARAARARPHAPRAAEGIVLSVDAVMTFGVSCRVVRGGRVQPRAAVRHKEYRSGENDLVLIGLLAMIRWRLIELDRRGDQVVDTRQLLDMCVTCMMVKSRRSLYVPVTYLYQHTSERHEKLEACRLMQKRCSRGETTELDRLQVRELLFDSVCKLMDKYGFEDRRGDFARTQQDCGFQRTVRRMQSIHRNLNAGSPNSRRGSADHDHAALASAAEGARIAAENAAQLDAVMRTVRALGNQLDNVGRRVDTLLIAVNDTRRETHLLRQRVDGGDFEDAEDDARATAVAAVGTRRARATDGAVIGALQRMLSWPQ